MFTKSKYNNHRSRWSPEFLIPLTRPAKKWKRNGSHRETPKLWENIHSGKNWKLISWWRGARRKTSNSIFAKWQPKARSRWARSKSKSEKSVILVVLFIPILQPFSHSLCSLSLCSPHFTRSNVAQRDVKERHKRENLATSLVTVALFNLSHATRREENAVRNRVAESSQPS